MKDGAAPSEKTKRRGEERKQKRVTLTLHLSSLADLGRETGLDGSDTTSRAAVVASNEVETVLSLVEFGVGGFTGFASDVFDCWKQEISTFPKRIS